MAHVFQPKHTVLSKAEAEELLKKFNISKEQLPKIKKSDPALPKEAKVGDIIKIERKIKAGEESEAESQIKKSIYYRVVVP
ncbi:MAG: DNA-directed RNA polymerase subunit RpoH/Rpb5 C-terminal domain-containing protein [Candidatus Pacearchaeota archaeon]